MNNLNAPFHALIAYISDFDPTEAKLLNFRILLPGWHYGDGVAFSESAINDAVILHRQIYFKGFQRTDAFAGACGEIQVAVYHGDHYFQFERESSGQWNITHENQDVEVEFLSGQTFDQAVNYINGLNSKVCDSSIVYTRTIGTPPENSLVTWLSKNPRRAEVFPSLIGTVR
jgi:hypothetical protein